ncbi:MAG: hypothetical protein QNJ12_11510 [Ilumatobacter sp.]|uniref:hypothetical protein n=1 Tax=Ilumatobacter sp. TaxID=1967498 RepID=UPI00260DD9B2|nr:hypothetical protein [Ilumatobacter sp.]MDJ0769417.1 hypothetical protein [Ilumatobacter sp.]
MKQLQPSSITDQLWRSALTVLFTIAVVYISWRLISTLIAPLILIVVVLGIIRLVIGARRQDRW